MNALLHRNFLILQQWYKRLGDNEKTNKYIRLSDSILKAIEEVSLFPHLKFEIAFFYYVISICFWKGINNILFCLRYCFF